MSRIEVDPQQLGRTARALRRSLDVAREVAGNRAGLAAHLADPGSARLADAAREFLDRWGHGCRLVVEDGEALAAMLEQASTCYVTVESQAAAAFGSRP